MEFQSINPYDGSIVGNYQEHTSEEVEGILTNANLAFRNWSRISLGERSRLMSQAAQVLRDNMQEYARMITLEMGKPISESRSEVSKCAWVCDYYADHAGNFLTDQVIHTEASTSFVRHDPIGT
ncbi:MAG: aldehyde dehydrogenase family protein, partial [Saprospiraceae bacterium]|nr:aldehyde dehydrogenase family protein [Saprospiraceae bacterium]